MHFRFSSRLAKSVKAKCRTISTQYTDYRRNRKIAKSTNYPAAQSPQPQRGDANPAWQGEPYRFVNYPVAQSPQPQQGAANPAWKGEPYRFANDPDDWEKHLSSEVESEYGSEYSREDSISVQEEDLRCEYDVDAFIDWWLYESYRLRFP
ncbi:hypothetical protein NCS52_00807800 [Fusarium sp. LHS14.1]|nr:hypothetical protein NCS52_00807800 [Fusarium sp. LHS14.1]